MINLVAEPPQRKIARMAGLFYLIFILTLALSSLIRSKLILFGDASATASRILASQALFRGGFVCELVSAVFFLLAAWALYALLKPVNQNLALLFLLLNLGGVAVECLNMLNLLAALLILSGGGYLNGFQSGQQPALAMAFLNLYSNGFMIAQIFYGAWLFPLGYLVYKSGFLPKIFGILLMTDGIGVLIWFFQFFLLPGYPAISYPGLAVSFIAEVGLSLWLMIKGVRDQKAAVLAAG